MNGKSKKIRPRRTRVRFEVENTTEDHTDSSSTTSAEEISVRPASYIIAERERASSTVGVSPMSPSTADRGKFRSPFGHRDVAQTHITLWLPAVDVLSLLIF